VNIECRYKFRPIFFSVRGWACEYLMINWRYHKKGKKNTFRGREPWKNKCNFVNYSENIWDAVACNFRPYCCSFWKFPKGEMFWYVSKIARNFAKIKIMRDNCQCDMGWKFKNFILFYFELLERNLKICQLYFYSLLEKYLKIF
jgi:hypothetical protein